MKSSVDWRTFLGRHDMHVSGLPSSWHESPHFGNAMLGSMLDVRDGQLCIEVFRADVCDHHDESHGWVAYSRPRYRIGHFVLKTLGRPVSCDWRMNLWDAEMTGTITTDAGQLRVRHLVHALDMAIVTELTSSEGERQPEWRWVPDPAETTRPGYPANKEELNRYAERYGEHHRGQLQPAAVNPPGQLRAYERASVWTQDLSAGGQYATAWCKKLENDTSTTFVTIANTYPNGSAEATAIGDIERFVDIDRADWIDGHRSWWHDYYRKSHVSLPDARAESLYWQTVYRYGCTSRAGRYYVDTSGLWFEGGQWPYTTNDWNTQASHWGVDTANRLEQAEEIVRRLHTFRENLVRAVHPPEWREDSAYLTIATDGEFHGSRQGDMRYYDLVGALPWLLHNAWSYYRHTMDDAMLRDEFYPLLRRAINLYLHLVEDGPDGRIHLPRTYSPETGVFRDANFELALLKWGCHVLLHACRRLGIKDDLSARWQDVVDRLADFPTDENGFRLAADKAADPDHRHFSHLLLIYPLHLVNVDRDAHREAAHRSLEIAHGGSDGKAESRSLEAMVQTHISPIASALGEGEIALDGLNRLMDDLSPNGLWACSGNPCIESTLSILNVVQCMLLQSWSDPADEQPGTIRIFPALPSAWTDVEFHDLRAEGAFLVSAACRSGATEWVRIESLAGEPCRVKPGFSGEFLVEGPANAAVTEVSDSVFELELRKGEIATLLAQGRHSPHEGTPDEGRS